MQNLILHRMIRISSEPSRENTEFGSEYYVFGRVLPVYLGKISSSTYVHHLISIFSMQNLILHRMVRVLSRPPRENMGVWVKILVFWPCSTSMSRRKLLLRLCSPSNYFFGSRIKFCIELSQFQRDHIAKV